MAHPLNTYSDAVERLLRAAEAMDEAFGGRASLIDTGVTLANACRDLRRSAVPLDRYIGADTLAAAAREMADLMLDALTVHVYSFEDGERPPVDCQFVASIQRVRAALGMAPAAIEMQPTVSELMTAATEAGWLVEHDDVEDVVTAWAPDGSYDFGDWRRDLSPPAGAVYQWRGSGTDTPSAGLFLCIDPDEPMGDGTQYRVATMRAASTDDDLAFGNGVDWTNGEQRAAEKRGWWLELQSNGAITIALRLPCGCLADEGEAAEYIDSIASGRHPTNDDDVYAGLCRKAMAIVAAVTGFGEQG